MSRKVIKVDADVVGRVTQIVSIRSIDPVSFTAESFVPFPDVLNTQSLPAKMELKHSVVIDHTGDGLLAYLVAFEARALPVSGSEEDEDEEDAVMAIFAARATYRAVYSLRGEAAPNREDLAVFGASNAVYNCWPYWREFLGNATSRVGLATFTAPILVVQPRKRKDALQPASEQKAIPAKNTP